ncbi:MAG: hypothetical protein KKC50_08020 [Candidatus Omnitrophica bacterium]|nr:hypothetical protein [Candidatus Omnitrophota bacterium]MBU0974948.1 hypothetical protein [Patescibacteria group bacterium]
MTTNLNAVIKEIAYLNNVYRSAGAQVKTKLETLWEIGDCLFKLGVSKPHSMGWEIQRETKGLIKRPTIFRAHKIKQIWAKKDEMIKDIGSLKSISSLSEMLPLIDPNQEVRKKILHKELEQLYKYASSNNKKNFKNYVSFLKNKYSHGRLGQQLDRAKYLKNYDEVIKDFKKLQGELLKMVKENKSDERERFKKQVPIDEIRSFSNMCLSLTTKNNFKLYKNIPPPQSSATNKAFQSLFNFFKILLSKKSDIERARIRRLISAEAFAQLSDMITSIQSEESAEDYKKRQQLSIGI